MIRFKAKVRFRAKHREPVEPSAPKVVGRLPRVTKMMALAIRFDHLIRTSVVRDQADLARLGNVSPARVAQIMALLNLAPAIQEEILFLPRIEKGFEPIGEKELRKVVAIEDWGRQLKMQEFIHTTRTKLLDSRL